MIKAVSLDNSISFNSRKTLLLVEDEALIAAAQAMNLEKQGYTVIMAHSGDEAVSTALSQHVDLILMDIDLGPGLNGPHAAQKILQHKNLPIVFLTSHTEKEVVEKVKAITRYGYVIKNSGDFVLRSSIEMAFELFDAHESIHLQHELSLALNKSTDLVEGLKIILSTVMRFDCIDCGGIYMADPKSGALDLVVHQGLSPAFIERTSHYDADAPNVRLSLANKASYGDYAEITRVFDNIRQKEGLHAMASLPIMYQGRLIALLNCASHSHDTIPINTRSTLEVLAQNIGSAISRLRAETSLKESEKKYRQLFDHAPSGIYEVDFLKGRFVRVNPVICAYSGYTEAELLTMSPLDLLTEESQKLFLARMEKIMQGIPVPSDPEFCFKNKDGSLRWVQLAVEFLRSSEGLITGAAVVAHDITARKQGEALLRKAEEKYRSMVEVINDVIFSVDLYGTIRYVSPAVSKSTGYTQDDLLGKSFLSIIHPDDQQQLLQRLQELVQGAIRPMEYRIVDRDGAILWVRTFSSIEKDPDGNAIGITGVLSDITVRKRAELAMDQMKERYHALLENSADILYEVDLHGNFTYFHNLAPEHFGLTDQEITCTNFREYADEQQATKLYDAFHEVLRTDTPRSSVEWEMIGPNNKHYCVETSVAVIKDPLGKPVGFRGVLRDITERKQIEAWLKKSEEKYRDILTSIEDGYFEVDLRGYLTFCNPALPRMLKTSEDGFYGAHYAQFMDKRARHEVFNKFNAVYTSEAPAHDMEWEFVCADGSRIIVETGIWLIFNERNEKVGFRGLVRDISKRKQAEAQVINLLKEKELLLREVHHRIKNNMATVASLLSLQAAQAREPLAQAVLKDAEARIKSMSVLYDKLYRTVDHRALSLKEYLPMLCKEIMKTFPGSPAVKLELSIDDILLDADRLAPLGIIVNELLTNAMKHAFTGRKKGVLAISASSAGGQVKLVIRDNGAGLPASVDLKTSPGFGLTLVKLLVGQLRGNIELTRENGTQYQISFLSQTLPAKTSALHQGHSQKK